MEKITLLKPFRQTETCRLVGLEEVVGMIRLPTAIILQD